MGGCRCIFRDCDTSTYRNRSLSFFHFPTREPQRYERWIRLAKAQFVRDLPSSKQRNRVICARHFRDECFMNYKKNSLTRLAIPSIWRLSKNIAFDYENNIEVGELITLEPPTQTHLIPPENFICPLGFSDNDDFLNEKLTEMNAVMAQYDSTNNDELGMETIEQKSTKKRRLSQVIEKDGPINKVSKILNGSKTVPVSSVQNVYITENEDINDIEGDVAEKNPLTDILPVDENLFTLIRERDNVDNDQSLEQEDEDDHSQTTAGNLSDQTEEYFEEQLNKFVESNTKLNVNIENDESKKYSEREKSLNQRIKVLENDVSGLTDSLSKAMFDLEVKKMELKACVKKNLELEQQMQQHKDEYQKLQKQLSSVKDQNQKLCQGQFKNKQEDDKINQPNLTLTQKYENLQRENRELLEKCEKLEKLQNEHHQQQQQQVSTISTTKTNQCPSSVTSCVNPDIVTKCLLPKVQLFNSIKRYVSVTMASLLRMEMFGNADRTWKPDERHIAVDILRLGDSVYKYFVEEWRFRLPPMHETRSWLLQSLDNNAAVDDEDV